jgi:hypothetical protein
MIARGMFESMCGWNRILMGVSFASADTFRRSLSEDRQFMPRKCQNEVALSQRKEGIGGRA